MRHSLVIGCKPLVDVTQARANAPTDGLGDRIALVIASLGGTNLTSLVGKSAKQIQRYAQGKSEPPVTAITALAAAAGVRVEWLATGHGPMREVVGRDAPAQAIAVPQTDGRLLGRLTERILAVHGEAGVPVDLRQAVERAAWEHDRIVAALSDPDDRLLRAGEVIADLRRALLARASGRGHPPRGPGAGD